MPSAPRPFNKPLGSFKLKARPTTPATGASVMYLFLNVVLTPNTPFCSSTIPVSLIDAASEPDAGPVKPKQGTISPLANLGR